MVDIKFMIESVDIKDWKGLQDSVCNLMTEVGLTARKEEVLETPRGKIEIDVFAIDEKSVDKIKYVIECKNWKRTVPQSVVLSFNSVMQETGANIGFIVSRKGLQAGAKSYAKNTNISGLTFEELQNRYFEPWWKNYFCKTVAAYAEKACFYTEPFNGLRNEALMNLSEEEMEKFRNIQDKYCAFAMFMWQMDIRTILPMSGEKNVPTSIEEYKKDLAKMIGDDFCFQSIFWRDLLKEICDILKDIEKKMHQIFGRDIFEKYGQ